MLHANSHASRRIVGRFDKGESLLDALEALCADAAIEAGQVRAHGILSQIDLAAFDPVRREYVTVFRAQGTFELIMLMGSVSTLGRERVVNAHATVSYASHGQLHVVGGQLRSATVYAVEVVIDVFEDLELHRGLDADTGLPLWKSLVERGRPRTAAEPAPVDRASPALPRVTAGAASLSSGSAEPVLDGRAAHPSAGPLPSQSDWRDAARRSREILSGGKPADEGEVLAADEEEEAEREYYELEPGDILLHPRLGECTVLRVEDDVAAYIRITKSQRVSKLALSVVRLEPLEPRGDQRVFRVHAGA